MTFMYLILAVIGVLGGTIAKDDIGKRNWTKRTQKSSAPAQPLEGSECDKN